MNGILYEFTENISCTASGRERTKYKAEKRATTLCAAYYLQNKTTLLMGDYYVTKKTAMLL